MFVEGINECIRKNNVPKGSIGCSLSSSVPGRLLKGIVFLCYTVLMSDVVFEKAVGFSMQAKTIICHTMALACHVLASLDH